jgi:RHS repeat-associated protein
VRAARRYPFGEGNNADNDEFATYRKDTKAQHYYAWHRFYSATWGRFSSPDPYVMSGGLTNPQGWNRYSYVANDPVNYYDPRGLQQDVPTFTVTVYGVAPSFLMYGGGGGGHSEEMEVVRDLPEVWEGPDVWEGGGVGELPGPIEKNRDCLKEGLVDAVTAESLDKYLQSKGDEMKGLGTHLISYGKRFDVDPRLLAALAGAESTFGKYITSGKHNAWNWLWNTKEPSKSDFESWETAIHSVSKGLRKSYLNSGFDTATTLYGKYCSVPPPISWTVF